MKKNIFFLIFFLLFSFRSYCSFSIKEQFKDIGYLEIYDSNYNQEKFDHLYKCFDDFTHFLQKNPTWAHKLYIIKEHFINSKERDYYSNDFFGFFDESKIKIKSQIYFYYSTHFHKYICSKYEEFNKVPEISNFLDACFNIQNPCQNIVKEISKELNLDEVFSSEYDHPPIILKVVKYLDVYRESKAHYDGSAISILLNSTNEKALLLSPYKSSFVISDFVSPQRKFLKEFKQNSILIMPGMLLTEFSIYPTPHIVVQSGKDRYSAIAFAMIPNYKYKKVDLPSLPNFSY